MEEKDVEAAVEAHAARNVALLRRFAELGVSTREVHNVEFHFWAPGQRPAALLARSLYERGLLVLVISPTEKGVWNVEAGGKRTLEEAGGEQTTREFVGLAARFECTYDGWGASVRATTPS